MIPRILTNAGLIRWEGDVDAGAGQNRNDGFADLREESVDEASGQELDTWAGHAGDCRTGGRTGKPGDIAISKSWVAYPPETVGTNGAERDRSTVAPGGSGTRWPGVATFVPTTRPH